MSNALSVLLLVAADEARATGYVEITPAHLFIGLSRLTDTPELINTEFGWSNELKREFELLGVTPKTFRRRLRALIPPGQPQIEGEIMHRSESCKGVFAEAEDIARRTNQPLNGTHLLHALLRMYVGGDFFFFNENNIHPKPKNDTQSSTENYVSVAELGRKIRNLRKELLSIVFGQDHAVKDFVSGLFNIEVVRNADIDRVKPAGLFVFAGPPGVGKTFLAESGAIHLSRAFLRFDMAGFSQEYEVSGLVGSPPIYKGAQPGKLTEFVKKNPDGILLFDEIEKAHPIIIQLFLQILDAGRLQDKFTDEYILFRDTTIIFTTNAGSKLYENRNSTGIHQLNSTFHRNTILDALRSEEDPRRGTPIFPMAICSRLATGYPVLFNYLGINELIRIAEKELNRIADLLNKCHGQKYHIGNEIPLAIVMREGCNADARTIRSQSEAFLKEEIFKISPLFELESSDNISDVSFIIDNSPDNEVSNQLFRTPDKASLLFIGRAELGQALREKISKINWQLASNSEQAFDILSKESSDYVLFDLNLNSLIGRVTDAFDDVSQLTDTVVAIKQPILSARRYEAGQKLLEKLRHKVPEMPVFILYPDEQGNDEGKSTIDTSEELLFACVTVGGARGAIRYKFRDPIQEISSIDWEDFSSKVESLANSLRLERVANEQAKRNQVVSFNTAPLIDNSGKQLTIRCRNFRLLRAPLSNDTQGLLSDIERPVVRFDDVIGAAAAKEALILIREWLKSPRKYRSMGVELPKGVLLSGPPGTGKTLLARALAGESECAFLVEAATNFVTMWQGSGPENIRNLFSRARRYAPSIIFIDEIDAIGRTRRGGVSSQAEEMALNALLTEMDGFSTSVDQPVIVLAATNLPELLDPALKRRFSREIEVELPTRAERFLYMQAKLAAKTNSEVSQEMLERVAMQSQGLSIANIERIMAQVNILAIANNGIVNDEILSEAFETVIHGQVRDGKDPLRTARHEAGHALMMCLTGKPPVFVTIVGRGNFGGYTALSDSDQLGSQTKRELEDFICQILGGREAERLYYGESEGASTGIASDLQYATNIASAMVCKYGMSEEIGLVYIDTEKNLTAGLSDIYHSTVRRIIDDQSKRAFQLLNEHKPSLDRIAMALMDKNRLMGSEVTSLLSD